MGGVCSAQASPVSRRQAVCPQGGAGVLAHLDSPAGDVGYGARERLATNSLAR